MPGAKAPAHAAVLSKKAPSGHPVEAKPEVESGLGETKKLLQGKASQQQGSATSTELVVNLITCGLGTGVFTLPWSTAGSSVLPAVAIIGFVLGLNAWTISIIVEAGERHQTFNLGSLMGLIPGVLGPVSEAVCNIVMWLSTWLCLVSYIIVIVDSLSSVMGLYHRSTLAILAGAAVLPLCFLDQKRLAFTSTLAVVATANVFMVICGQFVHSELDGTRPASCFMGLSSGSIAMFSAMMQTVVIQVCILPMYEELQDRSPKKFNRIVVVSFSFLFVLCSAFAVIGYLAFGPAVSSNVLNNLPATHWGHITRLSAAGAVLAVYPIIINPMIAPLRNPNIITNRTIAPLATLAVVMASMLAATFVDDLGFVNVLNGSLSCGAFVAFAPSLVGLYLLGPNSLASEWRLAMYGLIVFGGVCSVLGAVMTDNYTQSLHAACMWA